MSKDPAFLFYPGDYLRDTQCLSENTQVAYDRIMCEHMRNTSTDMNNIVISHDKVNFFTKRLSEDEKMELFTVLEKVENGFQIYWVAQSIAERRLYSESRSKNRSKKNKTYENTSKHMVIEDVNSNNSLTNGNGAWALEKKLFLNAEQWQYKQVSEYKISKVALLEYVNVFLKRVELQEDYKSEKELKRHCANWLAKNISTDKTKALEEKRILPENYWKD